jgi:hypothetical protein
MSNQFSDIQIIECNRLHSEEAKGGNNEQTSLWTNNLQDILLLEPGDQVSVYQSFISERGAGQGETVEIKGVELGPEIEIEYINASKTRRDDDPLDNNLPSQCSKQVAEYKLEKFKIRDDTLRFTINYYKTANALNCMHLPRRYMYVYTSARDNYTNIDSIELGATRLNVALANSTVTRGNTFYQGEAFYNLTENAASNYLKKPNNDNSRYTLMIRDTTHFTFNSVDDGTNLPEQDMRDPENATYYTFKDLKTITLPAGFNSPDFIATEVSRQLQGITNNTALYQADANTSSTVRGGRFPIAVSKILESETYKAFYTGNIFDNSKVSFLDYFNLAGHGNASADKGTRVGWANSSGFQYLSQYNVIGCKYPELYETGRLLNRNHDQVYQGIKGAQIKTAFRTADGQARKGIEIDIPYNKERCDEFKAFFDAQKLYPEIIENLNADKLQVGYLGNNNSIDNTRWMHMNRWDYNVQSLAATATLASTQLGWGGYYEPRHTSPLPSTVQLSSILIMLYFDPNQENTFYSNPITDGLDQYTYGCLGRSENGNIMIYPTRHVNNGYDENPNMWSDELLTSAVTGVPGAKEIEENRKIGFDMHFGAPGMYYMLPLCGWSDRPDPQSSYNISGGKFVVPNNQQDNKPSLGLGTLTDLNPWKKLLYIGADQPSLNWDGSFFSFSGFHTGMNRGNDDQAGNPAFPTETTDDKAQDTVYFINPPNYNNDFTPDRTPYAFDKYNLSQRITLGGTAIEVPKLNVNYEPWRVYDMLCGIFVDNFGVPEEIWDDSLWGLLGFTYAQFHGTNNRLVRVDKNNANDLSLLTTNAEVIEGDTKIFHTNWAGTPIYKNMITTPVNIYGWDNTYTSVKHNTKIYPQIIHNTQSISIVADRLPTRMIRGYYTIRSNILSDTPFVGGKVNNTTMPIIGTVNKINNFGDFVFGEESNLTFTVTKPLRLASITCSVHDPDGSYARTDKQSTILFKITKTKVTNFNVAKEILETLGPKKGENYLENLGVL